MRILYLPNEYSQQRQYQKGRKIYPVLMAMEAEWYRKRGHEVYWGNYPIDYYGKINLWNTNWDKTVKEPEGFSFLSLPHPDRTFTRWWEYQDNGNFKYLPATYIQSARDCWWHKCTFCRWAKKYPEYEVRPVDDVISEIDECVAKGFREVFDDSGTFPIGKWLDEFCCKLNKKLVLGCNMRLADIDYSMMKKAGFRMLLFGVESANQETLDRINKGVTTNDIKYVIKAAKCGLDPHIAVMFGYPWESDSDAIRTLQLVWWLLRKGYAKTAQASFYDPPDGDRNFKHRKYIRKIYGVGRYPSFWFNKLRDIGNKDDLKYLWKSIKTGWKEVTGSAKR